MAWDKETELRLRQVIKDSGVALLKENLVQGTWGNTAVRLDEDHMLVTPTGLDYIALTPEDMPVVQISDPSVWSDGKKPTSERKSGYKRDDTLASDLLFYTCVGKN